MLWKSLVQREFRINVTEEVVRRMSIKYQTCLDTLK